MVSAKTLGNALDRKALGVIAGLEQRAVCSLNGDAESAQTAGRHTGATVPRSVSHAMRRGNPLDDLLQAACPHRDCPGMPAPPAD